jgi:hypothetical protein
MPEARPSTSLLLSQDSPFYQQLMRLAHEKRWVFFAGLPGTGKSLWMHQLTHLAAAAGRQVHVLQWDVARPVFEAHPAGQRYPVHDGVTHGVIRLAVGRWARQALIDWDRQHPEPAAMLIGETPLIGHRLIELARVAEDAAEALLQADTCMFVVPVPAPQVRQHIEAERHRRAVAPLHAREREDAPPHVLQALWEELYRLAPCLGVPAPDSARPGAYDPTVYHAVYRALLTHRPMEVWQCETVLPTHTFSVYHFATQYRPLLPAAAEVQHYIQAVEQEYPAAQELERQISHWYRV